MASFISNKKVGAKSQEMSLKGTERIYEGYALKNSKTGVLFLVLVIKCSLRSIEMDKRKH